MWAVCKLILSRLHPAALVLLRRSDSSVSSASLLRASFGGSTLVAVSHATTTVGIRARDLVNSSRVVL